MELGVGGDAWFISEAKEMRDLGRNFHGLRVASLFDAFIRSFCHVVPTDDLHHAFFIE